MWGGVPVESVCVDMVVTVAVVRRESDSVGEVGGAGISEVGRDVVEDKGTFVKGTCVVARGPE